MIDEVLGGREVPLVYPPLNKDAYSNLHKW